MNNQQNYYNNFNTNTQNYNRSANNMPKSTGYYTQPQMQNGVGYNNINNQQINKPKKKGKLIFLLVFLSIILLITGSIGIVKWQNNVATEYLDNILSDQPFGYAEGDYIDYVTQDIVIPSEMENENGQKEKIIWETSDASVLNIDGKVNRPENESKVVKLTATIKHGIGKGEKIYNVKVVKTGVISEEDIYVVTEDEIANGIGKNDLKITRDENGYVNTIDGDFGETKVETMEDAMAILSAYSEILEIEDIDYIFDDVNTTLVGTNFKFIQRYDGTLLKGTHATINTKDNYLTSISCYFERDLSVNTEIRLSESDIRKIIMKEKNAEAFNSERMIIKHEDKYIVAYETFALIDGKMWNFIIDGETGKIIRERDLSDTVVNEEMVKSSGNDIFGQKQNFDVTKRNTDKKTEYRFKDIKRKIYILDGGTLPVSSELWVTGRMDNSSDYYVSEELVEEEKEITLSKNDFSKYPSGISAYKNYIKIYDWYSSNLNRKSFDGKGIPVVCIIDYKDSTDNASYWGYQNRVFMVGPNDDFANPFSGYLDILAHEYTHGVFDVIMGDSLDRNFTVNSINESYADIFSALVDGNWYLGENAIEKNMVIRDATFNGPYNVYGEGRIHYPTEYMGKNWNTEDEHINGIILTHVAYRMSESGFTNNDIARIWYQSLFYGLENDCTFVDVRYNVERAAKELNYSEENIKKIGELFDEVKIFGKEVTEIENYSVDGDEMLDDIVHKNFLVIWSPVGSFFGSTVMIFEEDNELDRRYTDEEISAFLTEYYNSEIGIEELEGELSEFVDVDLHIDVEYSRQPKWMMDIISKYAKNAKAGLIKEAVTASGGDEEEMASFFDFFLDIRSYKGTSYDFWSECMGIDFTKVSMESE